MRRTLTSLFPPLPFPAEMRQWDAAALGLGLPEALLMENAARAALDVLRGYRPRMAGMRVWLLMGGGNNGGDAVCLARHLLDAGASPLVLHARPLAACKGACRLHARLARRCGVPFRRCPSGANLSALGPAPDILVDGLLGTGFEGPLRSEALALVRAVNALAAPLVLALDMPSGLNGRTGLPCPEAVRATATVAFAAAKPGLALPLAAPWTGTIHVRDIGMPRAAQDAAPCSCRLMDGRCLAPLAQTLAGAFKNTYGHVLVIGGAPGLGGAAHLAARAALRAGAGLVTAAAPGAALADIKNGWAEIMTLPLGGPNALRWPDAVPASLAERLARCAALVVGPGLGRGEDAAGFLSALLALPQRPPTVFDADALMLLAGGLAALRAQDALTPHPGEAAALLGCSAATVQADRWTAFAALRERCPGAVLLKGAGSLAGQGDAPALLCPWDVPQLSVGGSGDVLAGCLGGLLASRPLSDAADAAVPSLPPLLTRVAQAVAWHALAGRRLAASHPLRGCAPSALADALPLVLADILAAAPPAGHEDALAWPA